MASLVTSENWACVNDRQFEFQGVEVSDEIKSEILMSLMEELQDQVEEGNEERLNSVIQSLEAEINKTDHDDHHDSNMECDYHDQYQWIISDGEDSQSSDLLISQTDGQNWSVFYDELDANGVIGDEMNNLYMYPCGNEMMSFNGVTGFDGAITSDHYDHTCDEIAFDLGQGYSSFWQETLYDIQ